MAGILSGLQVFANMVGPIPLALLDDNYSALQTTLNTLSTFTNFIPDNGSTNNVNLITNTNQYVSYTDGLTVLTRVANTNTGPATLNINSMGARPILNTDGSQLTASELVAGQFYTFTYDAQRNAFVVTIPPPANAMTATAPSNPVEGQFWFRTTDGRLAIWYVDATGGQWVAASCCGAGPGSGGGGVTSGNLFAPPFTVGGPSGACFQVNADCSVTLGKGLTMGSDGHTWLYQGLTTYPLGALGADPGTASISLHGNANSTSPWLTAYLDNTDGTETSVGGIGGGAGLAGVNSDIMQLTGTNGIALGVGTSPCMTIGPGCVVTFAGNVNATGGIAVPTQAPGTATSQVASTSFVASAVAAGIASVQPGPTLLAANGYITFPGGLILQWGSVTAPAGEFPVDVAVTFPKAFPHACWHVNATTLRSIARAGEANLASHFVDYITTTGCTIVIDNQGNPSTYYGQWLAIGN
jgi:YD repeat-containing protein